ncbi:MAG: AAA family ATPase [Thermaurantimonas sp.]
MRVAVVGPESTGKTQLCKKLAVMYRGLWVPEFARYYLHLKNNSYGYDDLEVIARGQLFWENLYCKSTHCMPIFFDTTLLTIKIWSDWKYGKTHPLIEENYCPGTFNLVLLTAADVPWAYDPQRENPNDREELFEIHVKLLKQCNQKFEIVSGLNEKRLLHAVEIIETTKKTFF